MMIESFLIPPIIAGLIIALAAGPIGSVIVWNRMSFFGDTIAHSALLGISLTLFISVNPIFLVVLFVLLIAVILSYLQNQTRFSNDAILAIFAHGSLALGLVLLSLSNKTNFNILGFLFGDILTTGFNDVYWLLTAFILQIIILFIIWDKILLITINRELAQAEGVNPNVISFIFMLILSIFVASAIKLVGVLLTTSLLIIPAATARKFTTTPTGMAVAASCFASLSIFGGFIASLQLDTPTGPSIVVFMVIIIFTISCLSLLKKILRNYST